MPVVPTALSVELSAEGWRVAARTLARRDPVLRRLVKLYDGERLEPRGDAFGTLARAIVGQQISVKAAASVWARLEQRLGEVTPENVARARLDRLRRCGLSQQKARYCRSLAAHFLERRIDPSRWHDEDDEAIIAELVRVKGIGRWTAEMFLIFYLLRPDVLPLGDIGLKRALMLHYAEGGALSHTDMIAIGEGWRPWRSVATWYLWRSLDPLPVLY